MSRRALAHAMTLAAATACTPKFPPTTTMELECRCDEVRLPASPNSHDGFQAMIDATRGATWPELDGIEIGAEAVEDPSTSDGLRDYERATDEKALGRGCGEGLSEMRTWIYAHAEGDVLEQKQRNYYTPAESAAWGDEHGVCA
jgi:hypothetical protein